MRPVLLGCAIVSWAATARAEEPLYETQVEGEAPPDEPERATSRVTREQIEERAPRSTPDALRYEPGVWVQQTSTGQASPFVRGRTGQHTVLVFDGIRLNNGLYRQGPNQYLATIDLRTVQRLEVVRGGGGTRWGSDAIGGVIKAFPLDPAPGSLRLRPGAQLRFASADRELGGRLQLHARVTDEVTFLGGSGARRVGLLEGGGAVRSPVTGEPALVPRLDGDQRTQLGTGFEELASDGRLVWRRGEVRFTAAAYDYRQLDAPRTDQCPPPFAPASECLRFDEQFHTLAYVAAQGRAGRHAGRVVLSFQRQHERKTRTRPASFVENVGRDDVNTFGAAAVASGGPIALGVDAYHDRVASKAFTILTDVDQVLQGSRGQYLAGSRYTTSGAFAELRHALGPLELRGGARLALVAARAPEDPESGTRAVDRLWFDGAWHARAEWPIEPRLAILAGIDRAFRAPNLDDLTSRQSVGPGYQFENADLEPERAHTAEIGARFETAATRIEGWAFASALSRGIARASREADDCPPTADDCRGAWSRFQLVNLPGRARIVGVEAVARRRLGGEIELGAGAGWARGDGPNPAGRPSDPSLPYQEDVPLSRIPPLNGWVELLWRRSSRLHAALAMRFALAQERLAPSDRSDPRIPEGGTPGYASADVRVVYRGDPIQVTVVLENLGDVAYRTHGSSVNGPGRGLIFGMEMIR